MVAFLLMSELSSRQIHKKKVFNSWNASVIVMNSLNWWSWHLFSSCFKWFNPCSIKRAISFTALLSWLVHNLLIRFLLKGFGPISSQRWRSRHSATVFLFHYDIDKWFFLVFLKSYLTDMLLSLIAFRWWWTMENLIE